MKSMNLVTIVATADEPRRRVEGPRPIGPSRATMYGRVTRRRRRCAAGPEVAAVRGGRRRHPPHRARLRRGRAP